MGDYGIIKEVLDDFNTKKMIILGCKSENLMEFLLNYSKNNSCELIYIDIYPSIFIEKFKKLYDFVVYKEDSLIKLYDFLEYDAIFIDDNPNWFTMHSVLKIIEKNSINFPLTFVCNSVFPNERRDSYYYFNNIPSKFVNDYSKKLPISDGMFNDKLIIDSDNFHAVCQNSQKNGVLTAIEDFIEESNLSIEKTIIDAESGVLLLYFENHEIFKRVSNLNFNNEFCNLKIKHGFLESFARDNLKENNPIFEADDVHYLNFKSVENDNLITDLNNLLASKNNLSVYKDNLLDYMGSLLNSKDNLINSKDNLLDYMGGLLDSKQSLLDSKQSLLDSKDELLEYTDLSISLLKYNNFRFLSILLSYLYILFNFKQISNIGTNLKLFKIIKKSNWFNPGFYFKNNDDISKFIWFKILMPEVHYVCHGHDEGRIPNPVFTNKFDKEELIIYLMRDFSGV